MSKIFNGRFKGKSLSTAIGEIQFDVNGVADVEDEELVEGLLQMAGFERPDGSEINSNQVSQPQHIESSDNEETTQKNEENASDEDEEEEITEESLMTKNVPQLRKIAKDHDIDLSAATKKDEIVAIILGSLN